MRRGPRGIAPPHTLRHVVSGAALLVLGLRSPQKSFLRRDPRGIAPPLTLRQVVAFRGRDVGRCRADRVGPLVACICR